MTSDKNIAALKSAVPFWLTLVFLPLITVSLTFGGWFVLLVPVAAWAGFAVLDLVFGLQLANNDPNTPDGDLYWYRLITIIWFPILFVIVFGSIYVVTHSDHFSTWAKIGMMFGVGTISGTVGINYAHELMHQKSRMERRMADLLMAISLYSHFRTEHLLVHHLYVGTPRDTVTAPYNEGFHRFFPRVLWRGFMSAWKAEKAMLARKDLPATDSSNPFWTYAGLQLMFLVIAFLVGGWAGVGLFVYQAFIAIWQLELVNYVEHYGLTRKHLGGGKYEHTKPHHSWNTAHKVSNMLLINLQRHSDHHFKPDRRFPLLQNYTVAEAPQLDFGYPVMTALAMIPPLWQRVMNPKVRKWRAMYYPEIVDWQPYKDSTNPMPKGAS